MGDIVGLMKDFERVSEGDREVEAMKMLKGQFNFRDFYEQLSTIQKMGSLKDVMAKLPDAGDDSEGRQPGRPRTGQGQGHDRLDD
jgi:signal recognition particle subunit SRP54